jgi:hypothetical protein
VLHSLGRFFWLFLCALIVSCTSPSAKDFPNPPSTAFRNPQRVTIQGYDDDAMEPFASPVTSVLLVSVFSTWPSRAVVP